MPDQPVLGQAVPGPARVSAPPRPAAHAVLFTTLGTLGGLLLLAAITTVTGLPMFVLPFVASLAIISVAPAVPFSQPRSVLLGHLSAALPAFAVVAALGPSVWSAVLAAGLATAPMMLLRAPHPPANATAALIGLTGPAPLFLADALLPAVLVVIAAGLLMGRALPGRSYPAYWR
ncbi:HPP family protein [Actinomadura macrotermitis]|uniref:HPP family protein n=1 Tax=Actinomadura macrotermitis TaxID=2585200 RepID=UPI0012962C8A|nr:HPP family protein [Actinomadura macrotermitis]